MADKNVVWNYFTESVDNPKFAACCLCVKSISQGSHIPKLKTTAPLMRHLKSVHPEAVSMKQGFFSFKKEVKISIKNNRLQQMSR